MTRLLLSALLTASLFACGGGGSGGGGKPAPLPLQPTVFTVQQGQASSYVSEYPPGTLVEWSGCPSDITCVVDYPLHSTGMSPTLRFFATTTSTVGNFTLNIRVIDGQCVLPFGCVTEVISDTNHQLRVTASADPALEFDREGYSIGSEPTGITLADVNTDGITDIVTSNRESSSLTDGSFSVLLGTPGGQFGQTTNYQLDAIVSDAAVADVNGDGSQDILVALTSRDSFISVFLGEASGSFSESVRYLLAEAGPLQGIRINDINGDGNLDVILAVREFAQFPGGGAAILSGLGDGTFQVPVQVSAGEGNVESFDMGDVDGDGYLDMVFTRSVFSSSASANNVAVLIGNSLGGFGSPLETVIGTGSTRAVSIADMDENALNDLLLVSELVYIAEGQGGGSFTQTSSIRAGWVSEAAIAGDMNNDGHLDVLIANNGTDSVTIALGDGRTVFGPSLSYAAGNGPSDIATADFDGDGTLDFAVSNFYADELTIALNR